MIRVLSLFVGLTVSATAMADGFVTTNDLQAVTLNNGGFTMSCKESDGTAGSRQVTCPAKTVLEPVDKDYFESTSSIHAKFVRLSATHEDGSTKTVDLRYFQAKQRTKEEVQLWGVDGLLEGGTNIISVTFLSAQSEVLGTGQSFVANVSTGTTRTCNNTRVLSPNPLPSCSTVTTSLCDSYFENENFCKY